MKPVASAAKILLAMTVLAILSGCAQVPLAGQTSDGAKEYFWGAKRVGQTFLSSDRNLNRIDVYLYPSRALAGKKSNASRAPILDNLEGKPAVLKLFSYPEKKLLAESRRPAEKVKPGFDRFSFDPLPGSKGRQYYFEIQAPKLTSETAIAVAFATEGGYAQGEAHIDGEPIARRDLRFKPVIMMGARMLANSVASRLAGDPVFMIFWGLLVALTAGALIAVLRRDDDSAGQL